jgi:hypothetical protein
MKKLLSLMVGIVLMAQGCQTGSELTDSEKEAMVQAVKQASQSYWTALGQTYDNESISKILSYFDENSDTIWEADPVAFILNTNIVNKQADCKEQLEIALEERITTPCTIQGTYYSVLSDKKVLEVINGEASFMTKDSTLVGPFKYVNTAIWANIDGEWKMQFTHQATDL